MAPPSPSADGYFKPGEKIQNCSCEIERLPSPRALTSASLIPTAPAAETYISGIADINISGLFWGRLSLFVMPGVLPW